MDAVTYRIVGDRVEVYVDGACAPYSVAFVARLRHHFWGALYRANLKEDFPVHHEEVLAASLIAGDELMDREG